ncbi:hypothetical protein GGR52DRAFT_543179 [Hypoxylon sp. FL1284]|nr:hypothetical protein GGR52DRAFT_543179 [Hypoxylon sp. FL1284]
MSGRIEKNCLPPKIFTIRRHNLINSFNKFGFEVIPCICYELKDLCYIIMKGVKKCKKCTSFGVTYDGNCIPLSLLDNIHSKRRRIKKEESMTEERLF